MKSNMLKRVLLITVLSTIVLVSCKEQEKGADNASSEQLNSKSDSSNFNPLTFDDYLPAPSENQIVAHKYYTFSYDNNAEQAEWLAYELKENYIVNNDFKRPYFIEDKLVKAKSADWRNYKKSGYDRGHLCPAGDMEFDKNAYNDTFYTSNISPQDHDFNAGIWNRLEQKVRYWSTKYDGVYVITGGVLKKTTKTIGTESVVVPDYFYKIVFDDDHNKLKAIAFLMPNKKSDAPLYTFVVSIDQIEEMTGIDFFPKVNDDIENALEKNSGYKDWALN